MNLSAALLLLGLKLRLLSRALARGRGVRAVLVFIGIALGFSPFWVGLTLGAHRVALRFGAPAAAAVLGLVHFGWVATSVLLGSFAEGFDLRTLLRYPIAPRAAFLVNVLVAPLDFAALFLVPPLVAAALGTAAGRGAAVALPIAAAGGLIVLTTAALAQTLLALLGRYLRREWTRALFGLLVGAAFMIPSVFLRTMTGPRLGIARLIDAAAETGLAKVVEALSWFPLTAAPVRATLAAGQGTLGAAIAWLVAGVVVLAALIELGGRLAVREALERTAPAAPAVRARQERTAATARPQPLQARKRRPLVPSDLAVMVGRDLRTFRRTPQVLLGLMMSPLLLLMFSQQSGFGAKGWPFLMAFASLVSALNLSANQFGLDQAGVRLLFLLPVAPRRLLLAKNLACVLIVVVTAAISAVVAVVRGPRLDVLAIATALAVLAAALPVVLAVGNQLSVRHPWRMSFRLGGAPPGAMASGLAQMAALAAVALVLVPPLVLLPLFFGEGTEVRLGSLAIIVLAAGVLWLLWNVSLDRAARALEAGRERIIDRLARADENT